MDEGAADGDLSDVALSQRLQLAQLELPERDARRHPLGFIERERGVQARSGQDLKRAPGVVIMDERRAIDPEERVDGETFGPVERQRQIDLARLLVRQGVRLEHPVEDLGRSNMRRGVVIRGNRRELLFAVPPCPPARGEVVAEPSKELHLRSPPWCSTFCAATHVQALQIPVFPRP